MIKYLEKFITEGDYPSESIDFLIIEGKKFVTQEDFIQSKISEYSTDYTTFDYKKLNEELTVIAKNISVDEKTVHLLFYILLTQELEKIYEQKNIDKEVFKNTVLDLKYKTIECKEINGVWGLARAVWYTGFFNLTMFALGRLQFHIIEFGFDYDKNGLTLCKTDKVINIHIPASGKLLKEDCIKAFEMAKKFFGDEFKKGKTIFYCRSWLLFPRQKEFLNEKSSILMFMNFFDIFDYTEEEEFSDAWRIFGKPFNKDIVPKTSLQRAYYDFLIKGNKAGIGYGLFVF